MCFQLAIILLLACFLTHVEVDGTLVVFLELHHHERVSSLTLSQRRIQANNKQEMQIIGLGKDHKLLDRLVLNLVIVCFATQAEGGEVHVDIETASGCEMKNVLEGSHGVACSVPNIGLVQQSLVEELGSLYFLLVGITASILALCLLLRCGAWHVQPHFDELVHTCSGFATFCSATVDFFAFVGCKLDGDLVAAGKIGIGNLGIGYLEGRSVLDVEGELALCEFCLSPVPAPQ